MMQQSDTLGLLRLNDKKSRHRRVKTRHFYELGRLRLNDRESRQRRIMNKPTLWDVCVSMIERPENEGSKSNVAMNNPKLRDFCVSINDRKSRHYGPVRGITVIGGNSDGGGRRPLGRGYRKETVCISNFGRGREPLI